jgi:hypothetical protein
MPETDPFAPYGGQQTASPPIVSAQPDSGDPFAAYRGHRADASQPQANQPDPFAAYGGHIATSSQQADPFAKYGGQQTSDPNEGFLGKTWDFLNKHIINFNSDNKSGFTHLDILRSMCTGLYIAL